MSTVAEIRAAIEKLNPKEKASVIRYLVRCVRKDQKKKASPGA